MQRYVLETWRGQRSNEVVETVALEPGKLILNGTTVVTEPSIQRAIDVRKKGVRHLLWSLLVLLGSVAFFSSLAMQTGSFEGALQELSRLGWLQWLIYAVPFVAAGTFLYDLRIYASGGGRIDFKIDGVGRMRGPHYGDTLGKAEVISKLREYLPSLQFK